MPLIPRLQTSAPLANAPGPVLDRNQRPTMDTRGIQQGLAQFNDANKAPLMNPNVLAAPYEALGSVGRALGQAGDVLGANAIKRKEAESDVQIANAETRMDMELADFEKWKSDKSNAPDEWQPEWETRLGKLRKEFGEDSKINTGARAQIGLRLTRWSGQSVAGVTRDATKQTFALAKSSFLSSAESALVSGDYARHAEIVQTAQSKGYLFPHEVTAEMQRSTNDQIRRAKTNADAALEGPNPRIDEAKKSIQESPLPEDEKRLEVARIEGRYARQQEKSNLLTIAYDDPDRAVELANEAEKSGKISGLDRVDIEQQAGQAKSFRRKSAITEYKERLFVNDIPTPDELKADVRLSDYDRASIASLASGSVNDPAEFESALTAAMSFDPAQFGDEREAITEATNIEASFEARFDGAMLSNLKAELAKRQKRTLDAATEATDLGPALKMLDEEIEAGALGLVTKPVMQDGKPVMRDPKTIGQIQTPGMLWGTNKKDVQENDGQPVPLTEPDTVAREKAAAAQREIRRTLESEVQAGKLKDQAAITARSIELFKAKGGKMTLRKEVIDSTLHAPVNPAKPGNDVNAFIESYGTN